MVTIFPDWKARSFVDDDILLLTSSSIWYPVALPPVNPVDPFFYTLGFYSLQSFCQFSSSEHCGRFRLG